MRRAASLTIGHRVIAGGVAALLAAGTARAEPQRPAARGADRLLCHLATSAAERESGVPDQLLTAISRVETGTIDPGTGRLEAWPWSINVEGSGHVYASKAEAIAAVGSFRAAGARSIDVGCMQINLMHHPEAFASLDDAFDPLANARFAAQFLTRLFQQTGSWPHAAAAYHSETPSLGAAYQTQVLDRWAEGDGQPGAAPSSRAPSSNAAPAGAATGYGGIGLHGAETMGAGAYPAPFGPGAGAFAAGAAAFRPAVSRLPPGTGRDLAAYRNMPIAFSGKRIFPARF